MQAIKILSLTTVAAAVLAGNRFVAVDGNYPAAGTKALGVSEYDADANTPFATTVLGTERVTAGGPFDKGDGIEVGVDGKAVLLAAGVRVATAMQDSAGDGSVVTVLLTG